MVDRDLVMAKLAIIDRCLNRIAEVQEPSRKDLLPVDVEDITVLNLQRAIQAALDLGIHVAVHESHHLPDSTAEIFTQLDRRGIIDRDLAGRLRKLVGFRNIAVYGYQPLNPDIVDAIIERHLGDLRLLGARVVEAFAL